MGKKILIILQGKVRRDFYQLPADKPVEHLSICLLVLQLCQDQQNHSGVGLDLPPLPFEPFGVF